MYMFKLLPLDVAVEPSIADKPTWILYLVVGLVVFAAAAAIIVTIRNKKGK